MVRGRERGVLLVDFAFEEPGLSTGLWACAGGGSDPGETYADALRRALRAEGLDDMRWWTWAELQEADRVHASGDQTHPDFVTLSPRLLVQLLKDLMAHGRPLEPRRLGQLGQL